MLKTLILEKDDKGKYDLGMRNTCITEIITEVTESPNNKEDGSIKLH